MVSWAVSNIRVILGLYGDNGKENGNHYNGVYRVYVRISPILKPDFYKSLPADLQLRDVTVSTIGS